MAEQKNANRLISNNKKAYFDYFIEDKYEAGLVLHGTEVKSIRMGKCSIKEAYIQIQNGEVFINNMNITPYEKGNIFNKDPLRPKKLLLHQSEINKLAGQIAQKGYTIVPLQVYLSKGRVKMDLVVVKSSTISVIPLQRRIRSGRQRKNLKYAISIKHIQPVVI